MSRKKTLPKVPAQFDFQATAQPLPVVAAAEEGKTPLRRFSMVAYTGVAMALGGWPHMVVVDLAGIQLGRASRPILKDHDPSHIVGHTETVAVEGTNLLVSGVISGVGEAAREVVGASENGFPWQASLGAAVKRAVFVPEGKSARVNGSEFAGPVYVIRQSRLGEVSFVALGADENTRARVEAGRGNPDQGQQVEVLTMEFEDWVKAKGFVLGDLTEEQVQNLRAMHPPEGGSDGPAKANAELPAPVGDGSHVAAAAPEPTATAVAEEPPPVDPRVEAERAVKTERDRVSAIQEICAGEFPAIEREAVRSGWGIEATSQRVLKAMREKRPPADIQIVSRSERTPDAERRVLEAALSLRSGIDEKLLLAEYGEQVLDVAWGERDLSLQRLFAECLRLSGAPIPRHFGNDTIRAAFSTAHLVGILGSVANKRLLRSFEAQPVVATKLCTEGELNDFKESERYRLTDVGDLEPVPQDGEMKHGGLREDKATNKLGTFGKIFALTRQMIYNDDLGAFFKVPDGMGARGARKIDQLFFGRLLANPVQGDGKELFHADHKNYREGVDSALSGDSLAAALQGFLDQVDADGQPINVSPRFLLVPTGLKMTARELLNSVTFFATGSANKARIPTYNALADEDLVVVTSPYLSNTNYPGASQKSWYLFADPAVVDTFEIGYLRGRRVPTVEQGETDFDTLGIKFRVFFDLGVREIDHRGVLKSKGE